VPLGAVLALLGANGAGKTTTIRILTTLLEPDSGTVTIAGHDVLCETRHRAHSNCHGCDRWGSISGSSGVATIQPATGDDASARVADSARDLCFSDQLLRLVRERGEFVQAPRTPLMAPTVSPASWRSRCAGGAQNAFAADFHSWSRCAMSWARSSSLPPSSTWRSEGSARR
jgi:energy-coupling factor transporter ATP-binding protein EcfA2